jgi:ABC-type multidrug transport system fused ATPase/permease subunit
MKIIFRHFWDAAKLYPKSFFFSMGIIFVITIMNSLVPFGLRQYLNVVIDSGDYWYLFFGVIIFACFLMIKTIANIVWYISLDNFGGKYIEDISLRCEQAIGGTSMHNIDAIKPNVVKHIMYADILDMFRIIGHHIPTLIGSIAIILMSISLAFFYSIYTSLFILLALIFGIFISFGSRKIISKTGTETNKRLKEHHSLTGQFVDSLPLVQTNNILSYYLNKTSVSIRKFLSTAKKEDKKIYLWSGIIQNYNTIFTIALSALLAIPATGGSIVNLVFFTALANIIMNEGQKTEHLIHEIVKSNVSFANVEKLLCLPRRQGNHQLDFINEIIFDDVCFSYSDSQEPIFKNFNCSIKLGDCVRLEGSNGSGKSTFIKLLTGIYEIQKGSIFLNKESIRKYSQESLNEEILYVNQDEVFLNESIKHYLEVLTNNELSNETLEKYFKTVNLQIDDRNIDNNGLNLSVGQRKKILILKFLVRYERASVIILDEISEGLDVNSKKVYIEQLKKMFDRNDKIFIIVDHSIEDTVKFNKKIFFKAGLVDIQNSNEASL